MKLRVKLRVKVRVKVRVRVRVKVRLGVRVGARAKVRIGVRARVVGVGVGARVKVMVRARVRARVRVEVRVAGPAERRGEGCGVVAQQVHVERDGRLHVGPLHLKGTERAVGHRDAVDLAEARRRHGLGRQAALEDLADLDGGKLACDDRACRRLVEGGHLVRVRVRVRGRGRGRGRIRVRVRVR